MSLLTFSKVLHCRLNDSYGIDHVEVFTLKQGAYIEGGETAIGAPIDV